MLADNKNFVSYFCKLSSSTSLLAFNASRPCNVMSSTMVMSLIITCWEPLHTEAIYGAVPLVEKPYYRQILEPFSLSLTRSNQIDRALFDV